MPAPSVPQGLPLTGERTVPGIDEENYWFRRHEVAYAYIVDKLELDSRAVLEAGCGEGYGAQMLADEGARVVGLDYDALTVAHVGARYREVGTVRGDLQHLPVASASVDLVVNLQVIEHLHDQPGFLRECARVLRPGGQLVVSTPNRITFSPGRDTPLNPFHTRELNAAELHELLDECFVTTAALGVHHGPVFRPYPDIVDRLIATAPDQWDDELRNLVLDLDFSDFEIHDTRIDDSLDLLFVATLR